MERSDDRAEEAPVVAVEVDLPEAPAGEGHDPVSPGCRVLDGGPDLPGERIEVHNKDSVAHTVTAVPGSTPFGNFDTGDIADNGVKSFTAPAKGGIYQYYCSIHNFMTGEITVRS